ncbi:hypothetical protein D9758_005757 [Tetrapyrgos nigripes]|uniref:DNA 3'-5' helicase n=1 Tax=Tetrapyrgos nigripes TaxID=182062 RepID=A0A8H5LQE7_9AGAR|nr:hypothetical protein D9758_005757 [Tetrapyrgos nigripes]
MPSKPSWTDASGLEALKLVVSRCIPQWPNGLHDYQVVPLSLVLNQEHVLFFTGTGSGKAALFMIPLIVHRELAQHPEDYPSFPVKKDAVAIVITPLKGLASSLIHDGERFGLRGLSYCCETITEYRVRKKQDLVKLICACQSWDLICIDPEHLASPEWRCIMRNENFINNLILFAVDEAHMIWRWSPNFRPVFGDIGALASGFLPHNVPIIALTATCAPGRDTAELCRSLGLVGDHYHLIRRSNEQTNMHISLEIMQRVPGHPKYSQLLEYVRSGCKTVIHVKTIPTAYAIYEFLWDYIPKNSDPTISRLRRMRMYHALCLDDYNRETFHFIDSDPELQIVIATVGFSLGMNCMRILDSITYEFPEDLDDFVQQGGRGGRDPTVKCRSIAMVSPNTVRAAQEFQASNQNTTTVSKSKKKTAEPMQESKARFIVESTCHTSFINGWYGNSGDFSLLDCKEAGREVFCNLCTKRYGISYIFDPPSTSPRLSWLPLVIQTPSKSKQHRQSAKHLGKKERISMRKWLVDFQELVWSQFVPKMAGLCNEPIERFFSDGIIEDILDNFLIIDSLDSLITILNRHSWKYMEFKSESLFRLLTSFQTFIQTEREEVRAQRSGNKTKTRRKQLVLDTDDEENKAESSEGLDSEIFNEVPEPSNSTPAQHPRPKPHARAPRKSQPTVADWSATYGPTRRKRN